MSSGLQQLWWDHAASASIEFAIFALVVALLDLWLTRFAAPELRAALWLAVLAKLLVPGAFPAALRWSIPSSIVPPVLAESLHRSVPSGATSSGVASIAFSAWCSGVVLLASIGMARFRRLLRRRLDESAPAPPSTITLARTVAGKLGLDRPAAVRVFGGPGGPIVLGILRPVILVPRSLLEPGHRDELQLVLFHELAHVKRRDPLWSLLCIGMQVLYWFHPLVWMARRRLTVLRELACDQTVARALGGDTVEYRRTLITLAQDAYGGGLAFLTPRSQLVVRLRSLERPISNAGLLRHTQAALLFALLFAGGLPSAPTLSVPFPHDIPPLADLEGCLRRRYAVMSMLAHAENVEGSELAPLLSQSTDDPSQKDPR